VEETSASLEAVFSHPTLPSLSLLEQNQASDFIHCVFMNKPHGTDLFKERGLLMSWSRRVSHVLEVRHPRCVGSITKNFVYYTYSQTQLYFT